MIKAREIQQKARQDGVRDIQIEKDYILSWILWGIARHEALSKCLVFKGGTALKKICFDNYRFSEDLDFTLLDPAISNEQLVFPPVQQQVIINYSDLEPQQLLCYSLEEVLVEKLRSVMQRMQARDFYDIWYLTEEHGLQVDFHYTEFCKKCTLKELNPNDFPKKIAERLPQYKARWKSSMSDQIRDLPDFEKVAREVQKQLKKIPFEE